MDDVYERDLTEPLKRKENIKTAVEMMLICTCFMFVIISVAHLYFGLELSFKEIVSTCKNVLLLVVNTIGWVVVPRGSIGLFGIVRRVGIAPATRKRLMQQLDEIECEINVASNQFEVFSQRRKSDTTRTNSRSRQRATRTRTRSISSRSRSIQRSSLLKNLHQRKSEIIESLKYVYPIQRNLLFIILVLTLFGLLLLMGGLLLLKEISLLYFFATEFTSKKFHFDVIVPDSRLQSIASAYFLVCYFVGLYEIPMLRFLRQGLGKARVQHVILNLIIIQLSILVYPEMLTMYGLMKDVKTILSPLVTFSLVGMMLLMIAYNVLYSIQEFLVNLTKEMMKNNK